MRCGCSCSVSKMLMYCVFYSNASIKEVYVGISIWWDLMSEAMSWE